MCNHKGGGEDILHNIRIYINILNNALTQKIRNSFNNCVIVEYHGMLNNDVAGVHRSSKVDEFQSITFQLVNFKVLPTMIQRCSCVYTDIELLAVVVQVVKHVRKCLGSHQVQFNTACRLLSFWKFVTILEESIKIVTLLCATGKVTFVDMILVHLLVTAILLLFIGYNYFNLPVTVGLVWIITPLQLCISILGWRAFTFSCCFGFSAINVPALSFCCEALLP
ncbi:unknown protein [Seminavis robusta]|uniref:Uncharacterized protein n=1 Tax=Seminavis robusta TaxID=568900 RepID=A0A9N8E028_9STRA|nr:unknown protein [Seminavis robusta]|eukprot:Sro515_g158350.1 n/a (223) ;mRNA; r:44084-44752